MSESSRPRLVSRVGHAVDRLRRIALGQSSEEASERRSEQLGQTLTPRPDGCLIWVLCDTAATAGPVPAVAHALSQRLEQPVHVLATPIEEKPLVKSVAEHVVHQYAPGDTDGTVKRFLDHWSPDFGIVIGHPPRPHLLASAKARGVPLYGVAAKRGLVASPRRFPSYLGAFDCCFAASASEANLLRSHLRNRSTQVEITGPLSDTVYALPCNEAECDDLSKLMGGRPVWLAADVQGIEIDIVEAAHRKAFRSAHRLLMILVPAPDEDGDRIVARLEDLGWRVARRTYLEEPDPEIQIYVADTVDELGLWYRLAPVSFVGGSFQNGVEPTDPYFAAALGSAVLHGPNTGANPARFQSLEAHSASLKVANAEELGEAIVTLLAPDKAASLAQAGWAATTESAHVVERLAEVMEERFYELEDAG